MVNRYIKLNIKYNVYNKVWKNLIESLMIFYMKISKILIIYIYQYTEVILIETIIILLQINNSFIYI